MQEQIDRLASQAGDRATAHALLRGKSEDEAKQVGMAEAAAVARRLKAYVHTFGCLPRPVALPGLDACSGPLVPPMVHIRNTVVRFDIDVDDDALPRLDDIEGWLAEHVQVRFTDD